MIPDTRPPLRRHLRIVLSPTPLLFLTSVPKAAAIAFAELGSAAFFLIGVASSSLGAWAPWCVAAAWAFSAYVRAIDIESWGLLIAGGLAGRARQAFGVHASRVASAVALIERLLLTALTSVVVAHYLIGAAGASVAAWRERLHISAEDLPILSAALIVGGLWLHRRNGLTVSDETIARSIRIGVGLLIVTVAWGLVTVALQAPAGAAWVPQPISVAPLLLGFAIALPAVGGGEALAREAHELASPRVLALRRTARFVVGLNLVAIVGLAFLFQLIVPPGEQRLWVDAPLAGLAHAFHGASWSLFILSFALLAAACLVLGPAAHSALGEGEQLIRRLAEENVLPAGLAIAHRKLGTMARSTDVTSAAAVLVILVSSGQVAWLSRAYAFSLACSLTIKIATLIRLRARRVKQSSYQAPFSARIAGTEVPIGLIGAGLLAGSAGAALLVSRDGPSIGTAAAMLGLTGLLIIRGRRAASVALTEKPEDMELLRPGDLQPGQVEARPGNLLVAVRNPYALGHVAAALRDAGDRDVVVMTVRLLGRDVDDLSSDAVATLAERQLLGRAAAMAEQNGRPVRLLIVPAHDVFDAVVSSALRLQSSEIYVGESATLSAGEQARLLGEAWERAEKPESLKLSLVIHHATGRADTYHLGAHPPSLTPTDLNLIHRLWLDATRAVGPHVHHHDVVRAALTQMEQQLNSPQREEALASIRLAARPADELAAAIRERDFSRLRDLTRNRHASDLADTLTELSIEDQVVAFRLLARKDAAAVFEYLSHEAQEALLKAMAQEDVAALLNNMAPDDRTMFLEELPAAATRQLLALLTPAERAVASTLLGYPEHSVGRLMTPQYVAVRESWSVREVLDYIREHGQDSETLNVIYVVDDQGVLVDDIRIREFLLTSLDTRVVDLMDRRFVALKATDEQQAAVAAFRQYDRSALPVTDTAGMLIGIVTIDDMLDVAEAAATQDIQRIGGSEALDEPYTQIAFWRMVQKRAGWLTALFLGEMLTATAMGFFEQEISRAVVLALFVPLIISSGGNSGSQASTLVIRALALGEVGLADWWRVIRREMLAGLALGAILGSIGFFRITIWSAFSDWYGPHWLLVALTVGLALVGVVLWGTVVGSLLPFLLRKLKFDPAVSSAPFVATLVDVTGLVIYFSVALAVLRGTLL